VAQNLSNVELRLQITMLAHEKKELCQLRASSAAKSLSNE
jgi:hypothetical protein